MTLPCTAWSRIDTIRQVPPHLLIFNCSNPTASVYRHSAFPPCYNGRSIQSVHAPVSGRLLQLCPDALSPPQGLCFYNHPLSLLQHFSPLSTHRFIKCLNIISLKKKKVKTLIWPTSPFPLSPFFCSLSQEESIICSLLPSSHSLLNTL